MYNEIYGSYYYMMQLILNEAESGGITAQRIHATVHRFGFAESSLYFTPDAIVQNGKGYNLLIKNRVEYRSVLKNAPISLVTEHQKRLVKAMMTDSRVRLFMDDCEIERLNEALSDVMPLYDLGDIILTETAEDGDDFKDDAYRTRFRMILNAIKRNKILKIVFNTSRGNRKTVIVAPYKIEYGLRDDKFRLCGVTIHKHRPSRYVKLNVARIIQIIESDMDSHIDCEAFIAQKQLAQPIEIEVSNLRNGFERIFTQLSNYKRTSTYDPDTNTCIMQIHCMDDDVQELLIVLMSFGPAIKVLRPQWFKEKYVERVKRQKDMLKAGE